MKTCFRPAFAAALLVLAAPSLAADDAWFLFSRHGECSPIVILNKKLPAVGDADSPDEVARRLRRRGDTVELERRPSNNGEMVTMHLPQRGLSLIFVRAALCDGGPESGAPPAR